MFLVEVALPGVAVEVAWTDPKNELEVCSSGRERDLGMTFSTSILETALSLFYRSVSESRVLDLKMKKNQKFSFSFNCQCFHFYSSIYFHFESWFILISTCFRKCTNLAFTAESAEKFVALKFGLLVGNYSWHFEDHPGPGLFVETHAVERQNTNSKWSAAVLVNADHGWLFICWIVICWHVNVNCHWIVNTALVVALKVDCTTARVVVTAETDCRVDEHSAKRLTAPRPLAGLDPSTRSPTTPRPIYALSLPLFVCLCLGLCLSTSDQEFFTFFTHMLWPQFWLFNGFWSAK